MAAAVSAVYRVGRPRPRRAFGFGLAFRLLVRAVLDDVFIARAYTIFGPFVQKAPLSAVRVGVWGKPLTGLLWGSLWQYNRSVTLPDWGEPIGPQGKLAPTRVLV